MGGGGWWGVEADFSVKLELQAEQSKHILNASRQLWFIYVYYVCYVSSYL